MIERCAWAGQDPLYQVYHDTEWGVPEYDSRALWEKLVLDGFQAGLAWITILRKREAFRAAFAGFDPVRVAAFAEADVLRLMGDAGIVRSRLKIEGAVRNARAYLSMQEKGEDFAGFVWGMAGGKPIQTHCVAGAVPAQTPLSVATSKALRTRGFTFVGPVIVYAWMQATGIVNDHVTTCFRQEPLARRARERSAC